MTARLARDVPAHAPDTSPPAWSGRQSLWLLGARILPQLYLVAVSIMAARALGADGMGRQSLIAFVSLSLVTALTGGMPLAAMRFVSERTGAREFGRVRELVAWHWRIALCAAAAGATGLLIAAGAGAAPSAAWLFAAVVVAATVLHTVPSALLNGLRRWKDATIAGVVTGAISALAIVVVLATGGGIAEMFAVEAIGALASLAWTSVLARRALAALPRSESAGRPVIAPALRFGLIASLNVALTFVIWQRSELFFLPYFSGDAAVAIYSVAFASITALRMPFDVAAAVVIPTVARFKGAGALSSMHAGYRRIVRLTVFASVPAAVGAFVLAPPLLGYVFGRELAPAGTILMILAVGFPLVPLGFVSAALLNGLGRQRALLVSGAVAAALSIVLDIVLIPRFGAAGAAWGNVTSQVVATISVIVVASRSIDGFALPWSRIARLIVASSGAGVAGWLGLTLVAGPLGVIFGVALFVTAFVTAQSMLGVLDRADRAWLKARLQQCAR